MNGNNEKTAVNLYFDSLPEILPFAGKKLAELGYTQNDLQENMYLLFETDFLGQKQEVKAFVESWNEDRIRSLWFTCSQPLRDANLYFTKLYGEPYLTGMEPYVEVNGGTGYYMDIEKEDFEALGVGDLKIEKREEGHFSWVFTYEGADCRFDVYKDRRENLEEYLADVSYEKSETEFETLHTYVEEGYGEQVFANPFGDIWKITMTGDVSEDKLNAIRSLLEDHSWHKQ